MRQRAETGRGEESEKMEERREGAPERTPAAEKTEKNHEPSGDVISIVVPVYNGEACLMRCIRSLQEQSYPNLDIVLVDTFSVSARFSCVIFFSLRNVFKNWPVFF